MSSGNWGKTPSIAGSSSKAWGQPNTLEKLGLSSGGASGRGPSQTWLTLPSESTLPGPMNHVDEDDDSDMDDETDDELLSDDGFESDEIQKSQKERKTSKWFKELFVSLDSLTVEEINDPERQWPWHCPVCQCKGGPGAINWYIGLQPLLSHARTKGSKMVQRHRELAKLLEEEIKRRGISLVPAGEAFGKWKGLQESPDKEIVWPPMVMILNTRLQKDENDDKRWLGMGNQELLDYFSPYAAVKARHSYGPQGHRGISVLIFEASAVGYAEAERLAKHFEETGQDKKAWERKRVLFYPGGQRILYGYMAERWDVENFNQHSHKNSKLKYEMKSYQEMVVDQMKQMSLDNQQLSWFKSKVEKGERSKKALQESYSLMSEKLRKTLEENRIVKLKTKMHYEQNKEQMDFQENFFKDQIDQLYEGRMAMEKKLEKMQQALRARATQTEENPLSVVDHQSRKEEMEKFIKRQDEKMEELLAKAEPLMEAHNEKMAALTHRHLEEKLALEKEFNNEFGSLLESYTPNEG